MMTTTTTMTTTTDGKGRFYPDFCYEKEKAKETNARVGARVNVRTAESAYSKCPYLRACECTFSRLRL